MFSILYYKNFRKLIIISITSLIGAWSLVLGTTYLMGIYTLDVGVKALSKDIVFIKLSSYCSIEGAMMLLCWVLFAIIGFVMQYILFYNAIEKKKPTRMKTFKIRSGKNKFYPCEEKDISDLNTQNNTVCNSESQDTTDGTNNCKISSDLYGDIIQDYINKLEKED